MKVKISELHITSNDPWKDAWIRDRGDSVYTSPEYYYYDRAWDHLNDWPLLSRVHRCKRMDLVLESIREWGQILPIKVDGMNIISGHKRAAAMAFLGYDTIEVEQ